VARAATIWFSLPGGQKLFGQGDASDQLFFLRTGRLGPITTDLTPNALAQLMGAPEAVLIGERRAAPHRRVQAGREQRRSARRADAQFVDEVGSERRPQ